MLISGFQPWEQSSQGLVNRGQKFPVSQNALGGLLGAKQQLILTLLVAVCLCTKVNARSAINEVSILRPDTSAKIFTFSVVGIEYRTYPVQAVGKYEAIPRRFSSLTESCILVFFPLKGTAHENPSINTL
jgi:hypothetical protein